MNLNKTTTTFIVFAGAAVAGIVLNYAAFIYIKRANLQIFQDKDAAMLLQGRNSELFGKGENDVRAQVAELNTRIVDVDKAIVLIEDIESFAKINDLVLEINSVATDPIADPASQPLTEILHLRFEVQGSWQKINEFIFYLEHLPYRGALGSVAFSRSGTIETVPKWRLRADFLVLKEFVKVNSNI